MLRSVPRKPLPRPSDSTPHDGGGGGGDNETQSNNRKRSEDVSTLRAAIFPTSSSLSFGGKGADNDSSTVIDIIEAMRAAKLREKQEKSQQDPSFIPKWKITGAAGVRRSRGAYEKKQETINEISNRLEERVRRRMGKSVAKEQESTSEKVVQLPSRELNILEVSQIFRVSTRELREALRSMGELPTGDVGDEQIMVAPEIVEYIALDLGVDFERVDNSIQSDEEVLLQRRAVAEQAEDAYEDLPPRPPVVSF